MLTGKVLVRGDTLIVKMGLVDVENDAQVWGQQYTKRTADILTLQDEIAAEVLKALKLRLSGTPRKRKQTKSTEAYHLYLKGRFFWGKRLTTFAKRSISTSKSGLDRDPSYAVAYAGIADCYVVLGFTPYGTMKPVEAFTSARKSPRKKRSHSTTPWPRRTHHSAPARCYTNGDWAASERAFNRSFAVAPDNVGARCWYSTLLAVVGRLDEGIREAPDGRRRSTRYTVIAASHLSLRLYNARRYDDAIMEARKALELDPTYPSAHAYYAFGCEGARSTSPKR